MKICVKDVVKKNGKRKMMALILLFLAVSATAVAVLSIKHREFRLVIDGEQISEEEFLQAMGEVEFQVISYFRSQYDADTDGDFWTRDFKGEVPGASPKDCGNYLDMNLGMANYLAKKYLDEVLTDISQDRLVYPE